MAISGGTYRVNSDLQQSFRTNMETQNATVNSVISSYTGSADNGGESLFSKTFGMASSLTYETVGITPEMLSKITTAIDEYVSNLNASLDAMPTAVDYTKAFKGEGVTKAVENFVTSVKEICQSYIISLQQTEQQIIDSVNSHYSASDADLSGQLNSDAANIHGNA